MHCKGDARDAAAAAAGFLWSTLCLSSSCRICFDEERDVFRLPLCPPHAQTQTCYCSPTFDTVQNAELFQVSRGEERKGKERAGEGGGSGGGEGRSGTVPGEPDEDVRGRDYDGIVVVGTLL